MPSVFALARSRMLRAKTLCLLHVLVFVSNAYKPSQVKSCDKRVQTPGNKPEQFISLASQYNWRMPGLHRSTNQGSVYI